MAAHVSKTARRAAPGSKTNEIFIENGRFHGQQIAAHLSQTLGGGKAEGQDGF